MSEKRGSSDVCPCGADFNFTCICSRDDRLVHQATRDLRAEIERWKDKSKLAAYVKELERQSEADQQALKNAYEATRIQTEKLAEAERMLAEVRVMLVEAKSMVEEWEAVMPPYARRGGKTYTAITTATLKVMRPLVGPCYDASCAICKTGEPCH